MDLQNLAYALTQVVHNFGAVVVVATPVYAIAAGRPGPARGLLWAVLAGWGAQFASGALFGLVSWHFYGQLPDIHGIAVAALALKLLCATAAVALVAVSLRRRAAAAPERQRVPWRVLATLGATALAAAAFLRWFS